MRLADGRLAFSATDLSRHLACRHLTTLRQGVAQGEIEAPTPYDDPRGDMLKQRGIEHERRLLERFTEEGRSVEIVTAAGAPFSRRDPAAAAARTRDAMRRGADVVYQGRLEDEDGRWSGYPDFLLRVDARSGLGDWSYEVLDAKLARSAKGEALLQLLLYSDLLDRVQGSAPERMHLALGGGDGRDWASFRVVEYSAYYRAVRRGFEAQVAATVRREFAAPPDTAAEHAPAEHGATEPHAPAAGPRGFEAHGGAPPVDAPPEAFDGPAAPQRVGSEAQAHAPPEAHDEAPPETYPEPVEHCDICEWKQSCAERRRADDHLSLVAGITRGQRGRLVERGVATMAGLAALDVPVVPRLDGVGAGALARIRDQARVQDRARRESRRIHELVTPVEPDRGLAALPEPSAGDVFFDLEGDPFAADGGLEYLFGVADRNGGYDGDWALDATGEKAAFERFIDGVMARWERHPGFHIYHYGAYETGAIKRLMSRYATREDEVDRLLRGRVFVDLHRVVRQGVRASVESYSIKRLEPFYGFVRRVDLTVATRALIRFGVQLESGDAAGAPDGLRAEIEGYNRDDCLSTLRLADWLEGRRRELEASTGQPAPRPALRDEERDREQEPAVEVAALFEALTAELPTDEAAMDDGQRARRLLAHLLEFHRREEKSMWWEFFHRCGFTEEELVQDRSTLGGLTYVGEAGQVKRSVVHRYQFPEQTHDVKVGGKPRNPATFGSDEHGKGRCGEVVALDQDAWTIDLKRGRNSMVPHPRALVPLDQVPPIAMRESILRLAQAVAAAGFAGASPYRAAFDLLRRTPPRIAPATGPAASPGASLVAGGETPLDAVRRLAPGLDGSVLPVQGPPGSGKTYTGARMILDLLAAGKRVGVTANSHKVISNLLGAICEAADDRSERHARERHELVGRAADDRSDPHGPRDHAPAASEPPPADRPGGAAAGDRSDPHGPRHEPPAGAADESGPAGGDEGANGPAAPGDVRGIQKGNDGDGCPDERIVQTDKNEDVAGALATGEANLAAGTAWLWAREEMAGAVDVLVIDEAGQMSLAATLAVSPAAASLVLLGDPRQLDQPIQGVHPPGVAVSALGQLLGESATVDPARGVFLDRTWRMHPDLCAFTSEQFYAERLLAREDLVRQTVLGPGPLAGHGLRFLPVEHAGNTNASAEEAEHVAALVGELLDADAAWVDRQGVRKRLTLGDILVVAPYNAHVATLRAKLPDGARVAPSTSSRARRRPSSSTPWPPRPPTTPRAAWSSSTASTASTSPPPAPAAWPPSSRAPLSSRPTAAPPRRCASPIPSAASWSWPARIDSHGGHAYADFIDTTSLKAIGMAQLTVRNVNDQVVRALKQRAAAHGRSAEAEHRELLRQALLPGQESFAARARALRQRLRSSVDSSAVIRADRDREVLPRPGA